MTNVVAYLANGDGFMIGPSEKAILRIIERNGVPKEIIIFKNCNLKDNKQLDRVYWTRDLYSVVVEVNEND